MAHGFSDCGGSISVGGKLKINKKDMVDFYKTKFFSIFIIIGNAASRLCRYNHWLSEMSVATGTTSKTNDTATYVTDRCDRLFFESCNLENQYEIGDRRFFVYFFLVMTVTDLRNQLSLYCGCF